MTHSSLKLMLAVGLACATVACDDEAAPINTQPDAASRLDAGQLDGGGEGGIGGEGGAGGTGGAGGVMPDEGVGGMGGTGGVELDMMVDMADPDMAEPDMELLPDMAPDAMVTPFPPGDACGAELACEGANQHCFEETCGYSLAPNVYRMFDAKVHQPANSRAELQAFLQLGVANESLNLMFEAAGFVEGGEGRTRWFVGNGTNAAGSYAFRHNLPIQTWDGFWNHVVGVDVERDEWRLDGLSDFVIVVPGGQRELDDGTIINCDVRLVAHVGVEIWEATDEGGQPIIEGVARGHLLRSDVERVEIVFGGQTIRLIDFFNDADLTIDTDGDGQMDAYPFELEMSASPQPFADDNPAREHEPNACSADQPCQAEGDACVDGLCVHPACGG